MKKFYYRLCLALFPMLLYLVFFILFEPYNYFGLRPEKSGSLTTPMARVREFQRNPSEYIILGDSRMNHFDLDYVEQLTGKRYANLATGGQGLNLTKELYDWAMNYVTPREVVLDVSFYQLINGSVSPSAQSVFYLAEHPLEYVVTRDYVMEAFEACKNAFIPSTGQRVELSDEINDIVETDEKYRDDLLIYTLTNIYPYCVNYTYSKENLENVIDIAEITESTGGKTIFVTPPVQECIWEYVIEPVEMEPIMEEYKEILLRYAPIYDMEFKSKFALTQEYYDDGFHFNSTEPYTIFTNAIFAEESDMVKIRKKEE